MGAHNLVLNLSRNQTKLEMLHLLSLFVLPYLLPTAEAKGVLLYFCFGEGCSGSLSSDKLFFDSIRYRYDMRVFFSIRYDTIRYEGLKEDLLFEEFSANFLNFRRIFGEFSEFSANFWNFQRKKTNKSLVLRISRYSIWEVRYDILFDIRK